MTDGRIIYDSAGVETKRFHVRDGLAIKLWMNSGFQFGILTARDSTIVYPSRGRTRHSSTWCRAQRKEAAGRRGDDRRAWDVPPEQVCYIGDDLPDIPVMKHVGLAVSPADAATDARDVGTLDPAIRRRRRRGARIDRTTASSQATMGGAFASVSGFVVVPTRPVLREPLHRDQSKQQGPRKRLSAVTFALMSIQYAAASSTIPDVPCIPAPGRGLQSVVTPWVHPPEVKSIAMATDTDFARRRFAKGYLSRRSMAAGACKQLQTSEGMLLFQNWEQTDNDQWKLWPVTVVHRARHVGCQTGCTGDPRRGRGRRNQVHRIARCHERGSAADPSRPHDRARCTSIGGATQARTIRSTSRRRTSGSTTERSGRPKRSK